MNYQLIIDRGIVLGVLMTVGLDMQTAFRWMYLPNEVLLGWTPLELIEMGRIDEVLIHIENTINYFRENKDLGTEEEEL